MSERILYSPHCWCFSIATKSGASGDYTEVVAGKISMDQAIKRHAAGLFSMSWHFPVTVTCAGHVISLFSPCPLCSVFLSWQPASGCLEGDLETSKNHSKQWNVGLWTRFGKHRLDFIPLGYWTNKKILREAGGCKPGSDQLVACMCK